MTIIDIVTGTPLSPSPHGIDCLGNGSWLGYECCCDECGHFLTCFPGEKLWIDSNDMRGDCE